MRCRTMRTRARLQFLRFIVPQFRGKQALRFPEVFRGRAILRPSRDPTGWAVFDGGTGSERRSLVRILSRRTF